MSEFMVVGGWVVSEKVIRNGGIVIKENEIIDVGSADDLKRKYPGYEKLDAKGRIIIPGLINTHTHAAMSLLRGYADDLPLQTWLEDWIWPLEARLTDRDIELGAKLAAAESLLLGVTTINSMYHYFPEHNEAKAFAEIGIRGMIGHACFSWRKEKDKKLILDSVSKWHGRERGRLRVSIAPHAPYTVDPEYLRELEMLREELNEKYGEEMGEIIMCTHVAETKNEVKQIEETWRVKLPDHSIIKYLDRLGILSKSLLIAHAIYVSSSDMDIMARKGVKVSHNPVSNFKLAAGLCPVPEMIQKGITVSLGTDSAASNNSLDMFETMKFASLIHKFATSNPETLPAKEVFKMATLNGGIALGWRNLGAISKGYLADIVILNVKKPHVTPMYDVYSHLIYAVKATDVETVIVDGKVIVDEGKLLTVNVEKLIDEVALRMEEILAKIKEVRRRKSREKPS
ncbi:N-ethylammeline chlorohydrolase [Candidatus Geothermarchaeota archaeon]|nr:MAG: N-ethylammeline chlorohydrolase [Candidatus Geothermarchaeota archaeon]